MNYWVQENVLRAKERRPPLKGIAVVFTAEGAVARNAGMTVIPAVKKYLVADNAQRQGLTGSMHDSFTVDSATLQQILAALP